MNTFFQNLLTASAHGSIVILAVILLRAVLKKAPRKFICYLWMLAGIRLLTPVSVRSKFSLQPVSLPLPSVSSRVVLILWVSVAAIIGATSIIAYLNLQRRVRDAVKVPGGYESEKIETAFVLGFVKPKIYIPTGMSRETCNQILAHERTHLEKGDHWIKMIAFVALVLHWFNPLVWVAYTISAVHQCGDLLPECLLFSKVIPGVLRGGEGDDAPVFIDPRLLQDCAFTFSTHALTSLSGVSVTV